MAIMPDRPNGPQWLNSKYRDCLIKPMGNDGGGSLIHTEHIVDAALVAGIVFFAVILGEIWTSGTLVYLSLDDIVSRIPTAVIAFGLTFFVQWARGRGIDVLGRLRELLG